jgi:hypothetical protein
MYRFLRITLSLLLVPAFLFAQDDTEDNVPVAKKGFVLGIYMGAYFANKYTADAYDGYGFDLNGKRNDFANSYMYQKIVMQYGGGYGYTDQIANALNVNHSDWSFTEADMPINMHYTPAFLFGLQCRYSVDGRNGIALNLNVAKISAVGNFTIETTPPTGSTQINNSVRTFGIRGEEQRMMIQVGYNRVFGKNEKVNFFGEAGLNMTYSQFNKNAIQVGNLTIDLLEFYDYNGVQVGYYRLPRGMGLGAYAGLGLNLTMSEKFLIQIMYSPSYEGIAIGDNTRLKLQHSVGLRAYYNFL